jgi:hypothetical protein
MKYVVIHKDDINQNILDEIAEGGINSPTIIWKVDPPVDSPGGVDSDYRWISFEKDYPNSLTGYRKLDEDGRDAIIISIKDGQSINNKIANITFSDQDPTGRPIFRSAATKKGWHYQAHSIEFELNKLNSIYNKDDEGNDLGFTSLKVYDDSGAECTTQASADTDGVKTVVTWAPDFDFEVISGNIRQASKETVDSHIYVNAKIPTGLPAPNNYLKSD